MKLSTYIIVAICLCACSGDDGHIEAPADPDAKVQIRPKSNIRTENGKGSRDGGVIEPGTAIAVSVFRTDENYPANWSGVASDLKATIDPTGTVAFATPQYYMGKDQVKLAGIYPAIGSGAIWAPATGTATATIDGATDIMATAIAQGKSDNQPQMTFEHLLAQVHIVVMASNETEAATKWGTVDGMTINNRPTTCAIVLPAPTAGPGTKPTPTFGGTNANLAIVTKTGGAVGPLTATTGEQTLGYCMFAPVDPMAALPLTVTTSKGGTINVSVAPQTYLAGTAYKVVLHLQSETIEVKTTITPWQPTVDLYYDIDSPKTNARPGSTDIADWSTETHGDYDL